MSYDDPTLKEFAGYFEAKEPGRRERADAWATAIGLQKVDGLSTSRFLVETAKEHIEGRITQAQARRRIRDYYAAKDETARPDPELEEPDKVAERIVAVINDGGFAFTPEYFISIHKKLFSGVLSSAGKLRTVNIRKHEWVLKEASVTYGDAATLKQSLVRDFADEREFDYGGKPPAKIIPHFARFIAQIWQVHPFGEGNTRTTAVFAIKYLQSLGYRASNNMFKENSWYFRNALVRANYADYEQGVKRDWGYLERFFRNLLLNETHELKSRYLLIGLSAGDPCESKMSSDRTPRGGKKKAVGKGGQRRWSEKGGQKTRDRLIRLLDADPHLSREGLSAALGICPSAVQKHLAKLKKDNRIRRIGPDKGGHWEVVAP